MSSAGHSEVTQEVTHTRTSRGTRPCALPRRCDACGFRHSRDTHTLLVRGSSIYCTRRIEAPSSPWHVPHPTFYRLTRRGPGARRGGGQAVGAFTMEGDFLGGLLIKSCAPGVWGWVRVRVSDSRRVRRRVWRQDGRLREEGERGSMEVTGEERRQERQEAMREM